MDSLSSASAASTLLTTSLFSTKTSPKQTQTLSFHSISLSNPNNLRKLFSTRCSTKPDVDSDTHNNPTLETNSNSNANPPHTTQQQPSTTTPPTPAKTPSSSSSSSSSQGLVFDVGPPNSWDSREIGSPVVKRYLSDDQERWYMWYHGIGCRDDEDDHDKHPSAAVGLAVSINGIHWDRGSGPVRSSGDTGLVVSPSRDWWAFDTQSIRPSEVMIMSSTKIRSSNAVYWLYYTGFSSENVECLSGFQSNDVNCIVKSLPGLAISQDGRHWARIEGEHHSGALFDTGDSSEWDSTFISSPQVVYHSKGDLRMYYHSFDAQCGCYATGIARSRDGIRWVKLGKILGSGSVGAFDEAGVMNVQVVPKKDGGYLMVYEGVAANGQHSIGFAESLDGLKDWRRCGDGVAVLKPSAEEDGWDNKGVASPYLVRMDGDDEWRMYYRGIGKGGRTGIGMAISQGSGIQSFRRWTRFHL